MSLDFIEAVKALRPSRFWLLGDAAEARDFSGARLDAAYVNGTRGQGGLSSAVPKSFDCSTTGYVAGDTALATPTAFTLMAWVYLAAGVDSCLIGRWGSGGAFQSYILGRTAAGIEVFTLSGSYTGFGAATPASGWLHAAATRDSAGNGILYVNGKSANTGALGAPVNNGPAIEMGRKGGTSILTSHRLAAAGIWSSALSPAIIADLYRLSAGRDVLAARNRRRWR